MSATPDPASARVTFGPADGITLHLHEAREQRPLQTPIVHTWQRVDGSPWIDLHEARDGNLLRLPGLADFVVDASGHTVDAWPAPGLDNEACRQLYLNNIQPMALSRQGKLVLHASAVDVGGSAIVFVGLSGRGKSTLATSFAAEGHALIVDDGLMVEPADGGYLAMPGEHAVRLWRDSEDQLVSGNAVHGAPLGYIAKQRIPAGANLRFSPDPLPIRAVFLLGDDPHAALEIQLIRPAEAAMALIQYGFLLDVHDPKRHAIQMRHAAALAASSLVAKLDYPRDYTQLPLVRQAILRHAT